jgi:hypothetical protein
MTKKALIAVVTMLLVPMLSSAYAAPQQNLTAGSWNVTLFPPSAVNPGTSATLSLSVEIRADAYNLKISVASSGLSVTNSLGGGNIAGWDNLHDRDVREVDFYLSAPSSAPIGQVYSVQVGIESYTTPTGPFGLRSPLEGPEANAHSSFSLQVVPFLIVPQQGPGLLAALPLIAIGVMVMVAVVVLIGRR